nr:hypothetical protein [Cyclobacterium lianum]
MKLIVFVYCAFLVTFRIQNLAFIPYRFGAQDEDSIVVVIAAIFFGFA